MNEEEYGQGRDLTWVEFRDFADRLDLTIITMRADKHGSYVWEAGAEREGLTRYITLGLTLDVELDGRMAQVLRSIIIGADDGTHFTNDRFRDIPYATTHD